MLGLFTKILKKKKPCGAQELMFKALKSQFEKAQNFKFLGKMSIGQVTQRDLGNR